MKFHVEELLQLETQQNDEKDKIILVLGTVIDALVAKLEQTGHDLQYIIDRDDNEMNLNLQSELKDVILGCTEVELIVEVT